MTGQQMTALARRFPTFRFNKPDAPGLDPWDAEKLKRNSGGWSGGEKRTLKFLLSVWDGELADVCGGWDATHLHVFALWAGDLAHIARQDEESARKYFWGDQAPEVKS